jgi:hypothetical protein
MPLPTAFSYASALASPTMRLAGGRASIGLSYKAIILAPIEPHPSARNSDDAIGIPRSIWDTARDAPNR